MNTSLRLLSLLSLALCLWLLSGCVVVWRGQEVAGVRLLPGSRIALDGGTVTNTAPK